MSYDFSIFIYVEGLTIVYSVSGYYMNILISLSKQKKLKTKSLKFKIKKKNFICERHSVNSIEFTRKQEE